MTDPSLDDLATLADGIAKLAVQAGAAVMEVYDSDFAVSHKDDKSPVTEADQAGEEIILAGLTDLTPEIPVVAEEEVSAGRIPEVGDAPFWLVDPLDGTKEFIKRNGEFTVNIGLVVNRVPVLGAVLAPALDTLYVGWSLTGSDGVCRRTRGGVTEDIAARSVPAEGAVVLASRSHATSEALQEYLKDIKVASITNAGSSLKFCRIAEGAADLYPRFGPTCEWDTCAAHAVLRAAGGSVTLEDGGAFLYAKPEFLNPHFIARGKV